MSANVAAQDAPLRVGAIIADKYRLVRELGRGGMGTVYEAVHTAIGKHVAIKVLESHVERDPQSRARFLREAQTASLVESPHIVHVFDSGCTSDGTPYLVLELLRGEDLRARLKREGRLAIDQAITICEQTLRALVRTHASGIVHRDLKPENIFLCDQGDESLFVKVLDFGISKVTRSEASLDTLTHEGVVLGTAYYMSPEQARGETDVDGRSDLYAVGSIFFEMLAGRTPYVGSVYHAVLVDICTRDAADVRTLAPQIPEGVALIITRALSRNREDRYATAAAFLEALAPFTQSRAISADGTGQHSPTRVSQPAAVSVPLSSSNARTQSASRLGKQLAWGFILAIVASAATIRLIHKQFKAGQARERALLEAPAEPRSRAQRSTVSPAANVPSTPAASALPQPAASVSSSPTQIRRTRDSGAPSHRAAPRSSTTTPEQLKLKTEMP